MGTRIERISRMIASVMTLALFFAGAGAPAPALAAYTIDTSVIDSGGGDASSPGYTLAGSIGQSTPLGDATSVSYDLEPGFWAALVGDNTTPDAFVFAPVTGAGLGQLVSSNTITVTSITMPAVISITGGKYSIGSDPYTSATGTVANGQTVTVQVTSSSQYSASVSAALTIDTVIAPFVVTTLARDPSPDPFAFTALTDVPISSVQTSEPVTVSGINAPAPISVIGGTYSKNNGPFLATAGTVTAGSTVRVGLTAPATYATAKTAVLVIGDRNAAFTVATEVKIPTGIDGIDDTSFTPVTGAKLNTSYISNTAVVTVPTGTAPIRIVGGLYSKNSTTYTNLPGSVVPGDTVSVKVTSSTAYSTAVSAALTVGDAIAPFTVTTAAKEITPDVFAFTAVTNAVPSTLVTSNTVTITGINAAAPISIVGGTYSINGGAYTSLAGTITNGRNVRVKVTSSAAFNTVKSATLTIGGATADFSVTTGAKDAAPDVFVFLPKTDQELNALVTSNTIMVTGINAPTPVTITGGKYSVSGAAYTAATGTITNGKTVTVQVTAPATYNASATARLTIGGLSGDFSVSTPAMATNPLAEALDDPLLTIRTGATGTSAAWFGQNAYALSGGSAAQSGLTGNSQSTWMETSVTGPFSVSFYQKVSSQATYDTLKFTIDGLLKSTVSGSVKWQQKYFTLTTAGTHTLRWTYAKNASVKTGMDAAWVDKLVISPNTAVKLLAPNGGEKLPAGSMTQISWKAPAAAEKFKLAYSTDNGTTWKAIPNAVDFVTGMTYDWTVPQTGGNKPLCKVKVTAYNSVNAVVGSDVSDKAFAIETLKVWAPNGGEVLGSRRATDIVYAVSGDNATYAKTKLSYSLNNGTAWIQISAPTDTTYRTPGIHVVTWPTPTVTAATRTCKVKVDLLNKAGAVVATDMSDQAFTITPALLAPPPAPDNVTATAGVGNVVLTWDLITSPTVSSYNVYWSTTPGVTKTTGTMVSGVTTSTYTHTTTANGKAHYYVVTAVNSNGEGPASLEVSATPVDITAGLISYYTLDADTFDSVGVNHGLASGATNTTAGQIGGAYGFNGTTGKITAAGANMPLGGSSRTLSAWVRTGDLTDEQAILGWGPAGQSDGSGESSYIDLNQGQLRFNAFGGMLLQFTPPVTLDTWYHVAATYDGTTAALYVNGVNVSSSAMALSTVSTGTTVPGLYFGQYADNSGPLNGAIDAVGIWNRALTADEVAYLYSGGTGTQLVPMSAPATGLVSEWKFNLNLLDSASANDGMNSGLPFDTATKLLGSASLKAFGTGYVTLPIPAMDIATTSGTLGFWMQWNAFTQNLSIADQNPPMLGLVQDDGTGSSVRLVCGNQASGTLTVSTGTWYYLMIEWDHGTVNFYQDGILVSMRSNVSGTTASALRIGYDTTGGQANVWLDEMTLWSRVLNSSEKNALFNSGFGLEIK